MVTQHLSNILCGFSYEFVRYIRHKIDEYMGSLLSAEIGKRSITPDDIAMGQEPLLTEITNHILNSQQYVKWENFTN